MHGSNLHSYSEGRRNPNYSVRALVGWNQAESLEIAYHKPSRIPVEMVNAISRNTYEIAVVKINA